MPERTCSIEGCTARPVAHGWCAGHARRWRLYGDPLGGRPTRTFEERFWAKVDKRGPAECWLWLANKNRWGYGQMSMPGSSPASATHVSWELQRGPIPPGVHVLHRCDNPPCVNPAHLVLGTPADNMADKVAKGRQPRGEEQPASVLTEADVVQIRRRYSAGGVRYRDLAYEYGVSPTLIGVVVRRVAWRHIE